VIGEINIELYIVELLL